MPPYMAQYAPGMMWVPGVAPNGTPIMWDMAMMAMPMGMPWTYGHANEAQPLAQRPLPAQAKRARPSNVPLKLRKNVRAHSTGPGTSQKVFKDQPPEQSPEPKEDLLQIHQWPTLPKSKATPTGESQWPRFASVSKADVCTVAKLRDVGTQCDLIGAVSSDASELGVPLSIGTERAECSAPESKRAVQERTACSAAEGDRSVQAWGPANDWAWDQCSSDSDECPEVISFVQAQHSLPPAPSVPPPKPPQKNGIRTRSVRSCPTTPGSSTSTGSTISADSAGAALTSPATPESFRKTPSPTRLEGSADSLSTKLDMSSGSKLRFELPRVEPMPFEDDAHADSHDIEARESSKSKSSADTPNVECILSEVDTLADKLQQKLARLRKCCREAERLEDRTRQGALLNADQQTKATRLGAPENLREKVVQLESRLAQAISGLSVNACEVSRDEGESGSSNDTHQDESNEASPEKVRTAEEAAGVEHNGAPAPDLPSARPESGSSAPSNPKARLERRQGTSGEARAMPSMRMRVTQARHKTGDTKQDRRAAKSKVTPAAGATRQGVSFKTIRGSASSILWLCISLGILAILAVLGQQLHAYVQTSSAHREEFAVQLLPPGRSNSWTSLRPADAPLRKRAQHVTSILRAQDLEIARGQAVAQQVQAKVYQIRRQIQEAQQQKLYKQYTKQKAKLFDKQVPQDAADYEYWQRVRDEKLMKMQHVHAAQLGSGAMSQNAGQQLTEEELRYWQQEMYYRQMYYQQMELQRAAAYSQHEQQPSQKQKLQQQRRAPATSHQQPQQQASQ